MHDRICESSGNSPILDVSRSANSLFVNFLEVFMSIGKRVSEAFVQLLNGDAEAALMQICAPIDKTAKLEASQSGKKPGKKHNKGIGARYKSFVHRNMDIITGVGLWGPMLAGVRLPYTHPDIQCQPDGTCSLEEIIWHVIRCGLYHEAELPNDIVFTDSELGGGNKSPAGVLKLPKNLVYGLIMAVVGSPVNKSQTFDDSYCIRIHGENYFLNDWWGKAAQLRARMRKALIRTASASPAGK